MPYMTRLLDDLKAAGLMVETVPGWGTRGSASFAPAGVTCHWTAGPRGTTKRPSLNIVTYGRPGLPGPLCNVYLDRAGVAVIVAAGRANHAGAGGWKHLRGNSSVYGIEAESAGDDDWTDAQKAAYPRLVAAMLRGLGRDASYSHGHNEWAPNRKIDIRDWPMATMRTQVAKLLAGHTPAPVSEEDVMASLEEVRQVIRAELASVTKEVQAVPGRTWAQPHSKTGDAPAESASARLAAIRRSTHQLRARSGNLLDAVTSLDPAEVDAKTLAAELAAALPREFARQVAQELTVTTKED